jgi:hypothetical protein
MARAVAAVAVASGVAKLLLRTPSKGKFTVKARHLPGGKTFDVVVNNNRHSESRRQGG